MENTTELCNGEIAEQRGSLKNDYVRNLKENYVKHDLVDQETD
jgi:hypothetical protein